MSNFVYFIINTFRKNSDMIELNRNLGLASKFGVAIMEIKILLRFLPTAFHQRKLKLWLIAESVVLRDSSSYRHCSSSPTTL
jgi:hypothetical protein